MMLHVIVLSVCVLLPLQRFDTFLTKEGDDVKPDERLVCEFLVHCADISNPTRSFKVSKIWAERVVDEFFEQGDLEKRKHLTVSPNMDRSTSSR